jgi:CubicO group peptidase (beta-lactamase class C family)
MARFDRDGNGALDASEAPPELERRFAALDLDGSGALDRDELLRAFLGQGDAPAEAPAPRLPDGPPSWETVGAVLEAMVAARGLSGAFVEVVRGDQVLYSRAFGSYTRDTVLNVASATKWVTAAVLMTTVARDGVELDGALSRSLPWLPEDKARLTLAQLLSHTSGLPGLRDSRIDLRQGVAIELEQAAREIAAIELAYPPGRFFDYGGASFQLAGALAETVAGRRWEDLFQERIARPVGMTASRYGHPGPEHESATEIRNPNLQAGLFTSASDYLRFLRMIDAGGEIEGRRVLPADLVAAMERSRLRGLEKRFIPGGAKPQFEYGVGLWCEVVEPDGRCSVVSSPGAWGTYPWIDRRRDVRGLVVVKDRLPDVAPYIDAARAAIEAMIPVTDRRAPR